MRQTFSGLPASPGIGIGAPYVYRTPQLASPPAAEQGAAVEAVGQVKSCADQEWQRFLRAHTKADAELEQLIGASNPLVADIFSSQRLILHDRTLTEAVYAAIYERGADAVTATQQFIAEMEAIFQSMEDEYFANRSADVTDVGQKLIAQLQDAGGPEARQLELEAIEPDTILFAHNLTPSQLFALPREKVLAVALGEGTPTAHVSILARTLEIPLVCALDPAAMDAAEAADVAVVDGNTGQLVLHPTAEDLEHYTNSHLYLSEQKAAAAQDAHQLALTLDGHCIPVCANANGVHEVVQAFKHGADSIGLLRTEFLYLDSTAPPNADQQQQTLMEVASLCQRYLEDRLTDEQIHTAQTDEERSNAAQASTEPASTKPGTAEPSDPETESSHAVHRHRVRHGSHPPPSIESVGPPLTVRLLDVGGDKPPSFLHTAVVETNPFLGLRGLRLLMRYPDLLRTQLRAVVRTAIEGPARLRLMVPMVTNLSELRTVRTMLDEIIEDEYQSRNVLKAAEKHTPEDHTADWGDNNHEVDIQLGVLVEVPGLALMVEHVAQEVDFFSIGTNDLTQYTLAADRSNSNVATFADPLHPALLQLIRQVCRAGHKAGISVSVCGEIASDPTAAPLLIGLGVTELSANPPAIPLVKQAVRHCDLLRCRQLAEQALRCTSSEAVRKLLATTQVMEGILPPAAASPGASAKECTPLAPDDGLTQ